jgi:carboxyl-terminal processing protease
MRHLRLAALLSAALLAFAPAAPVLAQDDDATGAQQDRSDTYRQLKLFGDVFERVRADYVEQVGDKELIESAIQGMLSSLDPHSSYLSKENFEEMQVQTEGEFGGLGIEVTMDSGVVKVVSPIDETPAARAGIRAGDLIIALDGEPVTGLSLSEAVDKMRGKVGTDIELTIRRGNQEPFQVTITREKITIQSVRSKTFGEVGYLRITTFNEQTQPGLEEEIAQIQDELGNDLEGYVIDLRNNPGGLLEQAISVSDTFLQQGEIVSTRGRDSEDSQRYNAENGDMTDGKPLVVLINGGSASASEIVAGALQDHGRAIVMGTQSFGKGSVQTIIPLPGHGAMRLTTARYYTPSGRSIQAKGIAPDIQVKPAEVEVIERANARREADLRGALDNGDDGAQAPDQDELQSEAEREAQQEAAQLNEDYQLSRAVDLLRGLTLFNKRVAN